MSKALKMSGNQVLIGQSTPDKDDNGQFITESGIILATESVKGGSFERYEGTVLAIGPVCKRYKKGDYVMFGSNVFASFQRYGQEYLIVYEPYIWGNEIEVDKDAEVGQDTYVPDGGDA